MRIWRRTVIYAIIAGIIQAICVWIVFRTRVSTASEWEWTIGGYALLIMYNFGLLIFNPLEQGPPPAAFYALLVGTIFMFVIVSAIGETIIRLRKWKVLGR